MVDAYRVLVTGASGFVGRALFEHIQDVNKHHVFGSVRTAALARESLFTVGELGANTNWMEALLGQKVVIHVAARAHIIKDTIIDPLAEYRRVNVEGTVNLARQAATQGVKRFIFISSIGVNGNSTQYPFSINDKASPWDDYSQSKFEAEEELKKICLETGMEYVILRPPLVYGMKAPGNFGKLLKAVVKGLPLPLGAIHNRRSMVALDNLIDLIITCIDHPNAANQTFLVSDEQDVSTTDLLKKMAHAFGKKARLIPIPMSWIRATASLLGKKAVADRLCGSLQVDITHTKETLGWKPPVTMEQQLAKIAASMQSSSRDV